MSKKLQLSPVLLILFALVAITICYILFHDTLAPTPPQPNNLKDYKLVFEDDFNGNKLNKNKWATCYDWAKNQQSGCTNSGNNELEWYLPSQVSVSEGLLHLVAEKIQTKGIDSNNKPRDFEYKSGMITSGSLDNDSGRWLNQYGYYEIKMNAPEGKGIWPAFWLIPSGKKWPPEIDVMEILGDEPTKVINTYFWNNNNNVSKDTVIYEGKGKFTNSWHTYGVDWKEGSLDWYIDGQKVRGIKGKYVPSEPLMMVVNLAVGGKLPGSPDSKTKFPSALLVDYVRVYKQPKT